VMGLTERIGDMTVMPPEKLAAVIDEPVMMVGDGAMTYGELFLNRLGEKVIFAPSQLHEPTASSLGLLAGEKLQAGDHLDIAESVPVYIRSSDAELNLLQKKGRVVNQQAR